MKVKRKYVRPEIEILATEISVLTTVSVPQGTTEDSSIDKEDETGGGKHARSGEFIYDEDSDDVW